MTCKDFFNAQCKNGSFKKVVLDHKTMKTAGHCVIVFTGVLWFQIFLDHFRNPLGCIDHGEAQSKFFVSRSGKRM